MGAALQLQQACKYTPSRACVTTEMARMGLGLICCSIVYRCVSGSAHDVQAAFGKSTLAGAMRDWSSCHVGIQHAGFT